MEELLSIEGVTKAFGGIVAVKDFTLKIKKGEIVGLMGPNGAGKTTLLNIISGEIKPDSGRLAFKGVDITGLPPHRICHMGIARTYQIPQPFLKLSCLENVAIGSMYGKGKSKREAFKEAEEILEFVGFSKKREVCTRDIDEISLKRLELARALSLNPELLLIDEIAAGLTDLEIPELLALLKKINNSGITILLIEHVMRVMMRAVERVVVMDKGTKIAEGSPEEILENSRVIEAYFG